MPITFKKEDVENFKKNVKVKINAYESTQHNFITQFVLTGSEDVEDLGSSFPSMRNIYCEYSYGKYIEAVCGKYDRWVISGEPAIRLFLFLHEHNIKIIEEYIPYLYQIWNTYGNELKYDIIDSRREAIEAIKKLNKKQNQLSIQ